MRALVLASLVMLARPGAAEEPAPAAPAKTEPPKAESPKAETLKAESAKTETHKTVQLDKDEEQAVVAAYHALKEPEPGSKKIEKLPAREMARIDVSARIRSVSFGHRTWLWVPPGAKHFYVEYGRSTNTPPAVFGPFPVKPATPAKTPEPASKP
jgi:hypothetical protein